MVPEIENSPSIKKALFDKGITDVKQFIDQHPEFSTMKFSEIIAYITQLPANPNGISVEGIKSHERRHMSAPYTPHDIVEVTSPGEEGRAPSKDICNWCLEHSVEYEDFNQPVIIPEGVTNCDYAFYGLKSFNQDVIVPPSVTSATDLFKGCESMYSGIVINEDLSPYAPHAIIYPYYNDLTYCIRKDQLRYRPKGSDETVDMVHRNFKKVDPDFTETLIL